MFIGTYIFLLQLNAALLWKEMVNLFSWLHLMREDAQYKVLFKSLLRMCSAPASLCLSQQSGGTGEKPQALLEMWRCPWKATQGLKCLWLLLPLLDLLPYFLYLWQHRILQSHNSDNFPCASQLTPNLKSLAGGSFVVALASIDTTLQKGQQLMWDKTKPTRHTWEEKNVSSINTYRLSFQMFNPITKSMNQNKYLGEKNPKHLLLFAQSQ